MINIHRVESDLPDPWKAQHEMDTRVGKDPEGSFFVWIWTGGYVGWAYAGNEDTARELLALEPHRG